MAQASSPRSGSHRRVTPCGDIVERVRAKILDGTFAAGQRLPTHVMLEKEFRSTPATVAKALYVLKRDGFIRTEKGRAMYVARRPPHQHHYALVFEFPHDARLSQFFKALRNEAGRFESAGRHFSMFHDVGLHSDAEAYQRLLTFVQSHQLAGLIFTTSPHEIAGTPFLEEPGIPRVAIVSAAKFPGIPAVSPELSAFRPKALDDLASRGRRRIALLRRANFESESDLERDAFQREIADRALSTRSFWIQSVSTDMPHHARELVQLLFTAPPDQRPDALIIQDDNLVEHATAGLAAAGVRVPAEVDVVAHANFPWPTPAAVPVRRLGFDVRRLLELCVERVDELRRGGVPRRLTLLQPMFENELQSGEVIHANPAGCSGDQSLLRSAHSG